MKEMRRNTVLWGVDLRAGLLVATIGLRFASTAVSAATLSAVFPIPEKAWAKKVQSAADGGLFVSGLTRIGAEDVPFVLKLDAAGSVIWQRVLWSTDFTGTGVVLASTRDGGVLVGRNLSTLAANGGFRLMRLDAAGSLVWQHGYEAANGAGVRSCIETRSGDFACTGYEIIRPFSLDDIFVLRLDRQGSVQSYRVYGDGGPRNESARGIWETATGDLVVAGGGVSSNATSHDCLLVRLDAADNFASATTIGDSVAYEDCHWAPAPDGGSVFMAETDKLSGRGSVVLARLDASDRLLWQKHFDKDSGTRSLVALADGGLVATNNFRVQTGSSDFDGWLFRLDASGSTVWERSYGELLIQEGFDAVLQHVDADLVAVGYRVPCATPPCGSGTQALPWLLKVDSAGGDVADCSLAHLTTTRVADYTAIQQSSVLAMRTGTLATVSSAVTIQSPTPQSVIECGPTAGCPTSAAVPRILAVKTGTGSARLVWDPVSDPCHARYRVHRTAAFGMRPTSPPGSWPSDPPFVDASGSDLDGSDTDPQYEWTPGTGSEYYLVTDVGTDGQDGPVGSFGM